MRLIFGPDCSRRHTCPCFLSAVRTTRPSGGPLCLIGTVPRVCARTCHIEQTLTHHPLPVMVPRQVIEFRARDRDAIVKSSTCDENHAVAQDS